jgi:hypothetical protein
VKHFEAELDSALSHPPDVQVPRNFRQRLIARLPETPAAERPRNWQLPVLAALAALFLAALATVALQLGLGEWFMQPSIFLASLGVGTVVALAWLWRIVVRD